MQVMRLTTPSDDVTVAFEQRGRDVVRVVASHGTAVETGLPVHYPADDHSLFSAWWGAWLRRRDKPYWRNGGHLLRVVELFSGAGGLALGACEAAMAAGLEPRILLAVDQDEQALKVYAANLPVQRTRRANVGLLTSYAIDGASSLPRFAGMPDLLDVDLNVARGQVDLVLAGPPCEGHSNFNNRTRRDDPRNALYLDAVAAAVALMARVVVIENVPEAANDRKGVVWRAESLLRSAGYSTRRIKVDGAEVGLPQTRRRLFLVAAREFEVNDVAIPVPQPGARPHTVRWAIEDLIELEGTTLFDTPSVLSEENRKRVRYLHETGSTVLPNELRPDCHKNGHTYPSVYGKMTWDEPSQTITSGFTSPGRGRFVHPSRPRALTPHEAARIQTFPDWFEWSPRGFKPTKKEWTKLIGDAVPPMLAFAVLLPLAARLSAAETGLADVVVAAS